MTLDECWCGWQAIGPPMLDSRGRRWRIVCWAHVFFESWPVEAKLELGAMLRAEGAAWLDDLDEGRLFAAVSG